MSLQIQLVARWFAICDKCRTCEIQYPFSKQVLEYNGSCIPFDFVQRAINFAKDGGWKLFNNDYCWYCPACASELPSEIAKKAES
jgi:hypothetical protein